MVLVIPAIATPFHRTQLRELLLPITEHMRFDAAQIADFTDSEIAFCGNGRESFLQLNQCGREGTCKFTPTLKQAQIVTGAFGEVLFCHNHDICLRFGAEACDTEAPGFCELNQPNDYPG